MVADLQWRTLENAPEEPEDGTSDIAGIAGIADTAGTALRHLRSVLPQGFQRHVRSARELDRKLREEDESPFRTAVPALDRLLEGGLPRGQLVELVGSRTSGRFSTVLATLAAATSVGEVATLVDLGDGLDPATAEAMGVDLRRLLWLRPLDMKQALGAAEMVLASGFPLVAVDLGTPPVRGGRGLEAAWLRLARAAKAHGAALLVSTPYRVSGTAAGVVLKAERARAAWQGEDGSLRLLGGASSRLLIEKHRGRLPGQSEELKLTLGEVPLPSVPPRTQHTVPPLPGRVGGEEGEGRQGGEGERLRAVGGRF